MPNPSRTRPGKGLSDPGPFQQPPSDRFPGERRHRLGVLLRSGHHVPQHARPCRREAPGGHRRRAPPAGADALGDASGEEVEDPVRARVPRGELLMVAPERFARFGHRRARQRQPAVVGTEGVPDVARPAPPPPSSAAPSCSRHGSLGPPRRPSHGGHAPARPASRPPAPPPGSGGWRAAPARTAPRARTAAPRPARTGTRGCPSTAALSRSRAAARLAPAATGDAGSLTSRKGSTPTEFPATSGLHPARLTRIDTGPTSRAASRQARTACGVIGRGHPGLTVHHGVFELPLRQAGGMVAGLSRPTGPDWPRLAPTGPDWPGRGFDARSPAEAPWPCGVRVAGPTVRATCSARPPRASGSDRRSPMAPATRAGATRQ